MRRGGCSGARSAHFYLSAGGKEESWGSGARISAWEVPTERERGSRGWRLEVGGGPDGWAPPVSHQQERGRRLGQAQEGEGGARGFWAKMAERRGEEERKAFHFYFPNKIFKLFSK
jgi:hypothetical protein